ncbi:hypothetical protein [Streptomyces sp. NPDC007172]|uniref:hypothetical protein n=1 Tax=Streptomyces sp. NPDC007172 TaxID=3364776 RepID=UPI0036A88410
MNHDDLRYGNLKHMQTAWSETTPDVVHASWSGHLTACGKPVIEAKPVYESHPRDITCAECGATAVFDLNTARQRAKAITEKYEESGLLTSGETFRLREDAIKVISATAFKRRRGGDSWNAISTDFLMITGAATEKDGTSIFLGRIGLAVIDGLKDSEFQETVRYHRRDVDPIEPLNEMVVEIKKFGIWSHVRHAARDVYVDSGAWAQRMRISYDNDQRIFVADVIPFGERDWRRAEFTPPTSNARHFAQRTFGK